MRQRVSHREEYANRAIDPRWADFQVFLADMGERPEGTSLGRIDNDLGYSKENCRWETAQQQCANRKSTPEYGPYIRRDSRTSRYTVLITWLDTRKSFSSLQEAIAYRNALLEPKHARTVERTETVL